MYDLCTVAHPVERDRCGVLKEQDDDACHPYGFTYGSRNARLAEAMKGLPYTHGDIVELSRSMFGSCVDIERFLERLTQKGMLIIRIAVVFPELHTVYRIREVTRS
jgi:hypothetical protein